MVDGVTRSLLAGVLEDHASTFIDGLGFVASFLTLVAFAQKVMVPMRIAAIGANVFFIAYGMLGPYLPVLALHLILLPLNMMRLNDLLRAKSGRSGGGASRFASRRPARNGDLDFVLNPAPLKVTRSDAKELT